MSKSPVQLARATYGAAQSALEDYSSPYSKHQFTQPQLLAILVLKAFFQTDYRGIVALLADWSDLRDQLELAHVPHFSTLWHAEQRLLKKTLPRSAVRHPLLGLAFQMPELKPRIAA